jgi:predicted DNA-binding transcriptional regulator AlpA
MNTQASNLNSSGPSPALERLLNSRATAETIGIAERTLWALMKSGQIAHVRVGRRVMYRPEAIRAFVAAREQHGAAGQTAGG